VCVKIARALGLEHALLFSSFRREPSAHGHMTSSAFACVHRVATMHFFSRSNFPSPLTHIETLYLYEILQKSFRNELLHMICERLQSFLKTFCNNQCYKRQLIDFLKIHLYTYEYTYLSISNIVFLLFTIILKYKS